MPSPNDVRRTTTPIFAVAMVLIGIALCVRTVAAGGGALAVGLLLGLLFIGAGAGRLWVSRKAP
jgi:lipopolysaccharide export LptBFGC system permease protein LptF